MCTLVAYIILYVHISALWPSIGGESLLASTSIAQCSQGKAINPLCKHTIQLAQEIQFLELSLSMVIFGESNLHVIYECSYIEVFLF